jgi:hypothetical protein
MEQLCELRSKETKHLCAQGNPGMEQLCELRSKEINCRVCKETQEWNSCVGMH